MKGYKDNEKKYFSIDDPKKEESEKMKRKNLNLVDKFNGFGFSYEESKFEKNLTYRDIEKTLIWFQTTIHV